MNIVHFACCQTNALCLTFRTTFGKKTFLSTKPAIIEYQKACLKYLMEICGNYLWKKLGILIQYQIHLFAHKKVIMTSINPYHEYSVMIVSSKKLHRYIIRGRNEYYKNYHEKIITIMAIGTHACYNYRYSMMISTAKKNTIVVLDSGWDVRSS